MRRPSADGGSVSEPDDAAPDEEESSDPEASSGLREIVTWVRDFDWLHIPGAVRAISKLVTGVAETGTAWIDIAKAHGQARSQHIRDVTKAKSKAMDAIAKAAIKHGVQDPELVDRAVDRLIAEQFPKQRSRETIAKESLKLLAEDPPSPDTPPPDDDWLNMFTSFAEQATTERMQKHWADVLAREIRKPGSFSRVALQILSLMDAQLGQQITTAKTWVMQDTDIPLTHSLRVGKGYVTLLSLDAVGVLRLGSSTYMAPMPTPYTYYVAGHMLSIRSDQSFDYQAAILTAAGREVLQLAGPANKDLNHANEVVDLMRSRGADASVI
jgi:hypothetical protein